MTNLVKALAVAAFVSLCCCSPEKPEKELLIDGWSFSLDGSDPRSVDIPHDWGVEGEFVQEYPGETGKLRWWGRGEYRKSLQVSAKDLEGCLWLEIGGAMSWSKVLVGGVEAGSRPYGYISYCVDMTPFLHEGANEIAVLLDNPEESSRWYPGGGLYRNVYLWKVPKAGIAPWGINVTTPSVSAQEAVLKVETTLRCSSGFVPEGAVCDVQVSLKKDGRTLGSTAQVAEMKDGALVCSELSLSAPALWSPENPEMYELQVRVAGKSGSRSYEECRSLPVGIRSAGFRADGFHLNGEKTFLKGVCLHHDAGALGAAWSRDAWMRRLLKLKEMGCNAIRMSHNPPASELLDLCDSLGFLVIDELTDTWTVPKKDNGYARIFEEWAERDLVDMIRRDRCHPCVIAWSIGNEVGEQGLPDKWPIARMLTDICHREDPTRPTTAGCDNLWASGQPWAETIDVYGFNYKPHAYAAFRDSHPGKPFYGSETASCISSRGYYLFPVVDAKDKGWLDGAPYQVSSYDLYAPAWASKPDYEWGFEDSVPECAGEFVWTGYDYLGEPTPYNLDPSVLTNFHTEAEKQAAIAQFAAWGQKVLMEPLPSRSSYFGIMDLAGFPKDRFWLYQSRWRPDLPVAHILPHWTWPGREGEITPVHVYTSGSAGELFLNGRSLGVREKARGEYRLRWDDVRYESGELRVVTYKDMEACKAGRVWAEDSVRTAGEPVSVALSVDYQGDELVYVTATVVDSEGRAVPDASNLISFSVKGPACIAAVDAGDPTSHEAFRSTSVRAFHSLASVVLRRTGKGGVEVSAASDNLKEGNLVYFSK